MGLYARWPKNRHINLCLPVPHEVFSLMDFNYGSAGCHEHCSKDVDRRAVSHTGPMTATLSVGHLFGEEVGSVEKQTTAS